MSEQVYELGQARRQAMEAAVRVAYDDITESMARPDTVAALLAALPRLEPQDVPGGAGGGGEDPGAESQAGRSPPYSDLWSRLLTIGGPSTSHMVTPARVPFHESAAQYRTTLDGLLRRKSTVPGPNCTAAGGRASRSMASDVEAPKEEALENLTPVPAPPVPLPRSPAAASALAAVHAADVGAASWGTAFRKTFIEHRSILMPLLAFGRVYVFHVCWFYAMAAWSWGSSQRTFWLSSTAAVHWGSCCLLWTMQAAMSVAVSVVKNDVAVPYFSAPGAAGKAGHRVCWWAGQALYLCICWGALAGVLYVLVFTNVYSKFALAYGLSVLSYELLYRQANLGGYSRGHVYDLLLRLLNYSARCSPWPSAPAAVCPLYNPATHLRTGLPYLLGNAALWGGALGLKFVFDYWVIVRPAAGRMGDILKTDKLALRSRGSGRIAVDVDPLMAAAQAILLFLLTLISSGVAYSLACAVYGALQGVRQRIGSVRHWRHVRSGFHAIHAAMAAKILVRDGGAGGHPSASSPSSLRRAFGSVLSLVRGAAAMPLQGATRLLRWVWAIPPSGGADCQSWAEKEAMLSLTAPIWNAVVASLRGRDLLSDGEAAAMSFVRVPSLSPAAMLSCWRTESGRWTGIDVLGAKPGSTQLPPMGVYVGYISQMVLSNSPTSTGQLAACQEAYVYLLSCLVSVGAVPRTNVRSPSGGIATVTVMACGGDGDVRVGTDPASVVQSDPSHATLRPAAKVPEPLLYSMLPECFAGMPLRAGSLGEQTARKGLLAEVRQLVAALLDAAQVYKVIIAAPARGEQAQPRRTAAVDKLCNSLHRVAGCMKKMRDLPSALQSLVRHVVERQHYLMPAVRAQLDAALSALVASREAGQAPDRGAGWDGTRPSYEDFIKVCHWLQAVLRPSDEGMVPRNAEAVSLLADFCSGLLHPDMPPAPRVAAMRSVTTLIPHYHETVLYALSSEDARRVLSADGGNEFKGGMAEDEVLFVSDVPASAAKPSKLLEYLISEFPEELQNLLERCQGFVPAVDGRPHRLEDFLPEGRLYEHRAQLLMWASFRGQVLARTVDGMAMYRTALALQAVSDALILAPKGAMPPAEPHARHYMRTGDLVLTPGQRDAVLQILEASWPLGVEEVVARLVHCVPALGPLLDAKYGTLVSSQVFSKLAASHMLSDRWRAHGVALLATRYPSVKVAYLEQAGRAVELFSAPDFTYRVAAQDSVLVGAEPVQYGDLSNANAGSASDRRLGGDEDAWLLPWRQRHLLQGLKVAKLQVLFRQRLPTNFYDASASGSGVILGEGKPENQNSAIIYCSGSLLQTIDMNQDNTLAQAFKLRNATREFELNKTAGESGAAQGVGHLPDQHVAVVGYPEWIFSYRCGLSAELAAATERTFGTQIQRVMACPSAVRAHYGHPDLWNRLFTMTRGGISKANAVQHVSEDVFGGINALKRGGLSKYVSYISVGKGRDMGLDSILGFESKISKGCAEQLLSRDVRFLGSRLDFFRCMSLYHTGPGHFINTWLTVLTIRLGLWVQLLLLLGGVNKEANSIAAAVGTVQILQLGTMPLLAYLFNTWLETGLAAAAARLFRQLAAGGLLFHIFRSVTSAQALGRGALFGGAGYVATGRGFSLERRTLTQIYVKYGRSHLYLGADILAFAILILIAGNNGASSTPIPTAALWSSFLVAAALLAGPFWFTPGYFRSLKEVIQDAGEFQRWVKGSGARGEPEGWAEWNTSQLVCLRDDSQTQVPLYRLWSISTLLVPRAVMSVLSMIIAVSAARFATSSLDVAWVLGGSAAVWLTGWAWAASKSAYVTSGLSPWWRWVKSLVQCAAVALQVLLLVVVLFLDHRGVRLAGLAITLYANYELVSLVLMAAILLRPRSMRMRSMCDAALRHTDAFLGLVLSVVLAAICLLGEVGLIMLDKVQTIVQFNPRYYQRWAARQHGRE